MHRLLLPMLGLAAATTLFAAAPAQAAVTMRAPALVALSHPAQLDQAPAAVLEQVQYRDRNWREREAARRRRIEEERRREYWRRHHRRY